jgi:hypothetical protein
MSVQTNGRRITRDDLRGAYSELMGEGESAAQSAAPKLLAVGIVALLGILGIAYFSGLRRGRVRSAVVEVRRL